MKLDWEKIKPSEKFLAAMQIIHECTLCGKCCVNMAGIAYNSTDTIRMAKELGISRNEFVRNHTHPSDRRKEDRFLNTVGPQRACQFWSPEGCTKYLGRGQVCRLYPWTSPEQLETVRQGRSWYLYQKCRGMNLTYLKVLKAAEEMPAATADAILQSPLGNLCMIHLVGDIYTEETAKFAAKELGLPGIPEPEQLRNIAWNFAVAYASRFTPDKRKGDLEVIEKFLSNPEVNQ